MKILFPTPLLFGLLVLSCADKPDSEPDGTDLNTERASSILNADEETRSGEFGESIRMEQWANAYAAALETSDLPGFLDSWSAYGGDIDGDGDIDTVGLFSMCSGGNAVEQYAAVFLQSDTGLAFDAVMQIGWRPEMDDSVESIREGGLRGGLSSGGRMTASVVRVIPGGRYWDGSREHSWRRNSGHGMSSIGYSTL